MDEACQSVLCVSDGIMLQEGLAAIFGSLGGGERVGEVKDRPQVCA